MEHSVLEASRHELAVSDSLTVLLRCHDHGSRVCVRSVPDGIYVGTGELVVVREVEVLHYLLMMPIHQNYKYILLLNFQMTYR